MDLIQLLIVFAATASAVLGSFVVVPELLERKGYNPRSGFVRCFVWASFLLVVFVPAGISGFLFSVRNVADWAYLAVGLLVAILYDYYRLNPEKVLFSTRLRSIGVPLTTTSHGVASIVSNSSLICFGPYPIAGRTFREFGYFL